MSTITICLPDDLKARVAKAAEAAGTTSDDFILEALAEKVASAGRSDFHATANQRYARFLASGESIPWEEVCAYLMQRLAGRSAKRPLPRKYVR